MRVERNQVVLKYMEPSGRNYYVWPETEDIFNEDMSVIVSVLTAPCIVNDRMQYKFLNSELVKARQLL